MNLCQSVVLGLAAVCAQVAFAFEWPSSGTATVPAGETAAITDADIESVSNLTAIVLSDADSAVTANALSSALTLKANISGPGTLTFTDCAAGLTLTGNNHLLTGNFAFNNSAVTVASRYGLGSNDTAMAVFTVGSSSAFNFKGSGLTNNAPIKIIGSGLTLPSNDTPGEMFVQNNDLYYNLVSGGGRLNLRRLYMAAGTFYQYANRGYHYLGAVGGTSRFGKDAVVDFSGAYMDRGGTLQFDARPKGIGITQFAMDVAIGADEVFASTYKWDRQLDSYDYGFNLMGHTQTLDSINWGWRPASVTESSSSYTLAIKSATPGTLRLTGTPKPMPYKFMGQASFDYNGSGEFQLINKTCDTTGGMTVSSGTLTMMWKYGWNGTNALVKSGATWKIDTANVLTTGKARLVVETGGTLDNCGNLLTVESANLDGVELAKGEVYTAQWIAANCPGVNWSGSGSLVVIEESEGEFEWPTEPGAVAVIPMSKEVTVTDEDLPKIAILGGIQVKSLANLIFDGLADPYDLAVPLSGYGTVTVTDCARFAIVANNTNFLGHFEFSNTDTVVSNRFALGCIESAATKFTRGSNGHFRFMGGGLTNDVPLKLASDSGDFPYGSNETLVQNNAITILAGASSSSCKPRNLFLTRGLFEQENRSQTLYFTVGQNCTMTIGPDAGIFFGAAHMQAGYVSHYVYCSANNRATGGYAHYDYGAELKFGATNAFASVNGVSCNTGTDGGGIDLNGYDQLFTSIAPNQYTTTQNEKRYQLVHSLKPAVLTVTPVTTGGKLSLRFTEQAGFTLSATYTQSGTTKTYGKFAICNQVSTTDGPLKVTSGTLTFQWNAGWTGTNTSVTVCDTGTLALDTTARSDFFTADNATGRSRTRVAIADSGTIALGEQIAAHVGYLSTNGVELAKGTYGGADAELDAAHTLPCLTGAGTITVQRGKMRGLMLILK